MKKFILFFSLFSLSLALKAEVCDGTQVSAARKIFETFSQRKEFFGFQTIQEFKGSQTISRSGAGSYEAEFDGEQFEIVGGFCTKTKACDESWIKISVVNGCLADWGNVVRILKVTDSELVYKFTDKDGITLKLSIKIKNGSALRWSSSVLKKGLLTTTSTFAGDL